MIFGLPLVYPDALYKRPAKEGSKWSREHAKPVPAMPGEPPKHSFRGVGVRIYDEPCMNRSYRCFWITNSPQTSRNKVNMGYLSPSWPYLYLYIPPGAKAGGPDPAIWFADNDDLDFPSVQRPEFSRPPIIAGLCWVHRPDLIFFYQTVRQAQLDCGQSTAIDQIKNSIVVGPASREFSK